MAKEESQQPNRRNICKNCCRFWPAYLNMLDCIFLLGFSLPIYYVAGWILATVWLSLHVIVLMAVIVSQLKCRNGCEWLTRTCKGKVCVYIYRLISIIVFAVTLLVFFLFVFSNNSAEFPGPCDNKSNACTRVSPWEKHRAEAIEMKLPVTFIDNDIARVIKVWFDQQGYTLVKQNETYLSSTPNLYHYQYNYWWGMISDFYLSVSNCSDVQGAQRVMVQSENRLGFKDYHQNPKEVRKLYETLDNNTNIKSLLFCE